MTTELLYLTLSAILCASLWIPHIVGQVKARGLLTPTDYEKLRNVDEFPDWVRRSNRAHLNLVEQFAPFAALILVLHVLGANSGASAFAAAAFFWLRIAHAVVMIAGWGVLMLRTVIFTLAWLAVVLLAWLALTAPAAV